jgi:hypothetical protein
MMKTPIQKARVHVTMRNKTEGSVLQGTVKAGCLGIETRVELESDQAPDRVAAVIRNAENGCFTMQALLAPVEVTSSIMLNGAPLPAAEKSDA